MHVDQARLIFSTYEQEGLYYSYWGNALARPVPPYLRQWFQTYPARKRNLLNLVDRVHFK